VALAALWARWVGVPAGLLVAPCLLAGALSGLASTWAARLLRARVVAEAGLASAAGWRS
jgi:hypothetical protein